MTPLSFWTLLALRWIEQNELFDLLHFLEQLLDRPLREKLHQRFHRPQIAHLRDGRQLELPSNDN